jgi:GRF zinc finger
MDLPIQGKGEGPADESKLSAEAEMQQKQQKQKHVDVMKDRRGAQQHNTKQKSEQEKGDDEDNEYIAEVVAIADAAAAAGEETRIGWARLFDASKSRVPLCEHGEPCRLLFSKKAGVNYGRSFYMCARPLGPSGDKERGTQWRCRTFLWCRAVTQDRARAS